MTSNGEAIVAGDKVKVLLISSKHSSSERMSRGVNTDSWEGVALSNLEVGFRFVIDLPTGHLSTSTVEYIGKGLFNTVNSSYSVEKL